MTITPFLALHLNRKKDAVLARQRARRVAGLLCFDGHEQACIAAGTFVIACQALALFGHARLCFQIENRQLQIFAEEADPADAAGGVTMFRLAKPLPPQRNAADEIELGWLVERVEETAGAGLFDEVVRQNQEILTLLHELRLCGAFALQKAEKPAGTHAA